MNPEKRSVRNTYEAAFYMTQGAVITNVEISKIAENSKKRTFKQRYQWIVELDHVSYGAVRLWKTHQAVANVRDIERERNRIKRFVKKILEK